MCAAGDWLQGPYVYALYQHYGFDRSDIGRLFIAGFGSSMIFGTIVGSLADKTCVPSPNPHMFVHTCFVSTVYLAICMLQVL